MSYQRVPKDRLRASAKDRDWSPDEDRQLREFFERAYAGDPTPQAELAQRLGRPIAGVTSRATKLGITRKRDIKGGFITAPVWKDFELAVLDEWYPKVPIGQVMELLPGRSKGSVFARANARGLVSPYAQKYLGWTQRERRAVEVAYRRGIAIADLAHAVGRRPITASKYATNHGFDFGRRPLLATGLTLEQLLALDDDRVTLPPLLSKVANQPSRQSRRKPVLNATEQRRIERARLAARRKQRKTERREEKRREAGAARERQKAQRALDRIAQAERRREEVAIARAQLRQARRDDATTRVNRTRAMAARQAASRQAQTMIKAGELSVPRSSSFWLKAAHRDQLAKHERERREASPLEQAKLALQRRGRVVYSMAVYGGPKDRFFVSGLGKDVTPDQLLAAAQRLAA